MIFQNWQVVWLPLEFLLMKINAAGFGNLEIDLKTEF